MKNVKFVTLAATALISVGLLTACGSSDNGTTASSSSAPATTESSAAKSDVTSGATVEATTDFATLQAAMSATGEKASWIGAITADVDASGKTLTVDGHFADPHGVDPARKLALYSQDADHKVTGRFTLTLDKLIVKSPGFYITNGTVKGDVYVEADGFHGQTSKGQAEGEGATIDGNLYFATEAQKAEFEKTQADVATKVTVTGEIAVKAAQ
ncbi:MAG: hypothetical protein LBV67_00260 [Streptococcaceae bacterium]|nr:hypothetical protein [Streptococcaceae bacterium]